MTDPSTPRPPQRPRVWPVFVMFVALMFVQLVVGVGVAAFALVPLFLKGDSGAKGPPPAEFQRVISDAIRAPSFMVVATALNFIAFATTAYTACVLARQTARERLSLRPAPWMTILLGTILFCASTEVLDCVARLLDLNRFSFSLPVLHEAMKDLARQSMVVALLVAAVLPAAGEELFFRGYIQTRLRQRWSAWTAIVLTSVVFGIMHSDPIHSPMAFLMGIVLGWLVEKTGSLWVSMAAHCVNNSIATLQVRGTSELQLSTGTELVLMAIVALGAGVLFLRELPPATLPAET